MVQRQLFSRRALPYYVLGLAALTVVHELVEVTPRAKHVFAPAARPRRLSRPLARKKEKSNGEPPAVKLKLLRGTDDEWDELVDRGSYVFPEGKQLRELQGKQDEWREAHRAFLVEVAAELYPRSSGATPAQTLSKCSASASRLEREMAAGAAVPLVFGLRRTGTNIVEARLREHRVPQLPELCNASVDGRGLGDGVRLGGCQPRPPACAESLRACDRALVGQPVASAVDEPDTDVLVARLQEKMVAQAAGRDVATDDRRPRTGFNLSRSCLWYKHDEVHRLLDERPPATRGACPAAFRGRPYMPRRKGAGGADEGWSLRSAGSLASLLVDACFVSRERVAPPIPAARVRFVVCAKNPVSWVVSQLWWARRQTGGFEGRWLLPQALRNLDEHGLRVPAPTMAEKDQRAALPVATLARLYANFYSFWTRLAAADSGGASGTVLLVPHEAVLLWPEETLGWILGVLRPETARGGARGGERGDHGLGGMRIPMSPAYSFSERKEYYTTNLQWLPTAEGGGPPRPEAEAPTTDAAEVWAPAVAISQLSAVQLGAFRQNFGADGLAAARRLGYAALPISKPF